MQSTTFNQSTSVKLGHLLQLVFIKAEAKPTRLSNVLLIRGLSSKHEMKSYEQGSVANRSCITCETQHKRISRVVLEVPNWLHTTNTNYYTNFMVSGCPCICMFVNKSRKH